MATLLLHESAKQVVHGAAPSGVYREAPGHPVIAVSAAVDQAPGAVRYRPRRLSGSSGHPVITVIAELLAGSGPAPYFPAYVYDHCPSLGMRTGDNH